MQRNVAFPRRCQAYSCLPHSMDRTGAKLRLLLILFGAGFNVGYRADSTPIAVAKSEVEGAGFPFSSLYVTPRK